MEDKVLSNSTNLDTLVNMIELALSFEDWSTMITHADHLAAVAGKAYQLQQRFRKDGVHPKRLQMKQPLVHYYGYSHMMKGIAYKRMGEYEVARDCISAFSHLDWFDDPKESECHIRKRFRSISRLQLLELDLLSGRIDKLYEYTQVLLEHKPDILPGLVTLIRIANLHQLLIDDLLPLLAQSISLMNPSQKLKHISDYHMYLLELIKYNASRHRYGQVVEHILELLSSAIQHNSGNDFKKSVGLFEQYRIHASKDHIQQYQEFVESALKEVLV